MFSSRAARRLALPSSLVGLIALATPAFAQDSQYWNIQYGPVGQLLGGQIVGSTRDLSATYYNPGGLALGDRTDFLLSVQAFSMRTSSLKPLDGGSFLDRSQTDFETFPGFVAVSFPRSWFGDTTKLAFSILTRQQFNERIDQQLTGQVTSRNGRYGVETLLDQRMSEIWGGLTLSQRLSDRFGLGVTLYGVNRAQRTRVEQNLQLAFPDGSGVSALVVNDFNYSDWRILGKVGLAWEGNTTRLGLAVTTPSAGLFGGGKIGFTRSATGVDLNGDGQPDNLLLNGLDESLSSDYKSPWAIAGGGAWRRGSLQLHVTGEWFAPVSQFAVLQGVTDTNVSKPIAIVQDLQTVFNGGVAAEYWLSGVTADRGPSSGGTAVYGAFHTDFSASPVVGANEAATSNQDWYHVTGGTAFSLGRNRFSLGVEYSFGKKTRDLRFGGLPASVPIVGEPRPFEVRTSRWVLVVGYLFGS